MFNFRLYFNCLFHITRLRRKSEFRTSLKRIIILLLFFTFYTLHTLINRLFGLFDDMFFFHYKKASISNPVFITGAPRTGTTFMHRSLSEDKMTFTSLTLAEILLAPSIIQKYFLYSISWIDKKIKSPMRRAIRWIEKQLTKKYGRIHKYSLFEPDEDELLLISMFSSLYLLFMFPEVQLTRKYSHFDENLSEKEKDMIMKYYAKNIKKHIYFRRHVNRSSVCYLAKSPVYISKIDSIYKAFPGCKIIYLLRDPLEVLPSWISMNSIVFKIFHSPSTDYPLKEETMELLASWLYNANDKLLKKDPASFYIVSYDHFIDNPGATIKYIYAHFNLKLTEEYDRILSKINNYQKDYRSGHKYSLEGMGFDINSLHKMLK